jgi:hypothetical protein
MISPYPPSSNEDLPEVIRTHEGRVVRWVAASASAGRSSAKRSSQPQQPAVNAAVRKGTGWFDSMTTFLEGRNKYYYYTAAMIVSYILAFVTLPLMLPPLFFLYFAMLALDVLDEMKKRRKLILGKWKPFDYKGLHIEFKDDGNFMEGGSHAGNYRYYDDDTVDIDYQAGAGIFTEAVVSVTDTELVMTIRGKTEQFARKVDRMLPVT